ncbi:hypothetical protein BDR22DRAFT_815630, partial [Usnea florida]
EVLIKPLFYRKVEGDLLRLVYKSNSFKYIVGTKALKVGDILYLTSYIKGIYIKNSRKAIDISAVIKRYRKPIIEVKSTFLF